MNNKEILQLVKARAASYVNDDDINMKALFLDNLANYSREIGFENTIDVLLPLINKIVNLKLIISARRKRKFKNKIFTKY